MRQRIQAAVIHTKDAVVIAVEKQTKADPENSNALRQQMKELALQKRLEEERQLEQEQQKTVQIKAKSETQQVKKEEEKEEDVSAQEEEEEYFDDEESVNALRPKFKPTFIASAAVEVNEEELKDSAEDEKLIRRQEAHRLLADFIRRGTKGDPAVEDRFKGGEYDPQSVDDTDGLEAEEERLQWQLRELARLQRDRQEREHWEREQLEMERIRNMTEEEKRAIDQQKQAEWESQPRSQYQFLQKYYHRGAFFGDAATSDPLFQRDYGQAVGADRANLEMLPEVLQVRDFGKKGRSKWKHLTAEDTTGFEYGWGQRSNTLNYRNISSMAGMRGNLNNPSSNNKRPKTDEK